MKLQGKNETIINIVEFFLAFLLEKIIENVNKIERNVTFRTEYSTTGNRIPCCIISSGSRGKPRERPAKHKFFRAERL